MGVCTYVSVGECECVIAWVCMEMSVWAKFITQCLYEWTYLLTSAHNYLFTCCGGKSCADAQNILASNHTAHHRNLRERDRERQRQRETHTQIERKCLQVWKRSYNESEEGICNKHRRNKRDRERGQKEEEGNTLRYKNKKSIATNEKKKKKCAFIHLRVAALFLQKAENSIALFLSPIQVGEEERMHACRPNVKMWHN